MGPPAAPSRNRAGEEGMSQDVNHLTDAIELVAAGSWAVESALRCLATDDLDRAQAILEEARVTMRQGLAGLRSVLEGAVRAELEKPERLARAIASLQELQDLQLEPLGLQNR